MQLIFALLVNSAQLQIPVSNFKVIMKWPFLSLLITAILYKPTLCVNNTTLPDPDVYVPPPDRPDLWDPCAKNDHLTDPEFTCCASIRYDAPPIYKTPKQSCFNRGAADKIVKSAWEAFKCLVDDALGSKSLTFESLAELLMEKLPSNVQAGIRTELKNMTTWPFAPYSEISALEGYQNYANAWAAYYSAENKACSEAGSTNQTIEIDEDDKRCYSWINQASRRGDCCKGIAIPYQLNPDPIVERYYALKNWTASHLMTLVGRDYDWKNTTIVMYSNNVAACLRTSMFIQQGLVKEDDVKKQIADRIAPNYDQIAESIIPKFFSKDVRDAIKIEVANETAINLDSDMLDLNNYNVSLYQVVYADEWTSRKYNENSTRFLFLTCRAHNLLTMRYKDSPITDFCY